MDYMQREVFPLGHIVGSVVCESRDKFLSLKRKIYFWVISVGNIKHIKRACGELVSVGRYMKYNTPYLI